MNLKAEPLVSPRVKGDVESPQRSKTLSVTLCHNAVMSTHAAKKTLAAKAAFFIHITYAAGSYYAAELVIVVARAPREHLPRNLRVGDDVIDQ